MSLAPFTSTCIFIFTAMTRGLTCWRGLFKKTAIEEMIHVEKLADRILFLKGDVEMNTDNKTQKLTEVKDMLMVARKMEEDSAKEYNIWANECSVNADAISKQLFESLVADEERHYNQFDTELENIAKFGTSYLALQSIERSKSISAANGNVQTG